MGNIPTSENYDELREYLDADDGEVEVEVATGGDIIDARARIYDDDDSTIGSVVAVIHMEKAIGWQIVSVTSPADREEYDAAFGLRFTGDS